MSNATVGHQNNTLQDGEWLPPRIAAYKSWMRRSNKARQIPFKAF